MGEALFLDDPELLVKQAEFKNQANKAARHAARRFAAIWGRILAMPGSGEPWRHGFRTIDGVVTPIAEVEPDPNPPSEPGEPPAKQTGKMAESIKLAVSENRVVVFTDHPAAKILEFGAGPSYEFGTPGIKSWDAEPVVIEPRPHLRPALAEAREAFPDVYANTMRFSFAQLVRGLDGFNISDIRDKLLDASSVLGNIQSLGIAQSKLFNIRNSIIGTEQVLGDVEALAKGNVKGRAMRRGTGRVLGKTLGAMVPAGGNNRFAKRVQRNILGGFSGKILDQID